MSDDQSTHCVVHQTDEQFHILVDSVEEYAIYMLDPTGNIVTWNSGAQKMKQYTAEEIIGKNFACFYTAEDVAAEKPQRNLRVAARTGHIREQGLRVRKDGSTFHAEVILRAMRDSVASFAAFPKSRATLPNRFAAGKLQRKRWRRKEQAKQRTISLQR